MRRIHAFELSDLAWFPRVFRDLLTDSLQFGITRFGFYDRAAPLVGRLLAEAETSSIVDLCSGATGPWSTLRAKIPQSVQVTFTDKFAGERGIEGYDSRSIDATAVPGDLRGARTIFTGFHHFAPESARAILADAARRREAIGIFEFTERAVVSCAIATLVPFTMWLTTPFMRPVTWQRIVFTYLLPIVPLCNLWDGLVSSLRTYSVAELDAMAASIEVENYRWEAGRLPPEGASPPITYLLGWPEHP